MTTAVTTALETLDLALAHTRDALSRVHPADLARPTPCAGWSLRDLLVHMDDALDAFTEAAGGRVASGPAPATGVPTAATLEAKACALRARWHDGPPPGDVGLGGHRLPTGLLLDAAALEIAVHGSDVARTLDSGAPLPDPLARALMPVAVRLVGPYRGTEFAPARPVPADAGPGARLLAYLGR